MDSFCFDIDTDYKITLGVFSFISWVVLYYFCSKFIKSWSRTRLLPILNQAYMTESFVSGLQGVLCGTVGLWAVMCCLSDVRSTKFKLINTYPCIGIAYFIYDLIAMYYSHGLRLQSRGCKAGKFEVFVSYLRAQSLMIAHHVVLVFFLTPALLYYSDMGHFFAGCFYCTEISTPFVNARNIISKMGLKNSKLYIVNGFIMIFIFALCRIAMFPAMYFTFLSQQVVGSHSYYEAFLTIPVVCHLCCLLLLAPQIYWFKLMLQGALGVIKKKSV